MSGECKNAPFLSGGQKSVVAGKIENLSHGGDRHPLTRHSHCIASIEAKRNAKSGLSIDPRRVRLRSSTQSVSLARKEPENFTFWPSLSLDAVLNMALEGSISVISTAFEIELLVVERVIPLSISISKTPQPSPLDDKLMILPVQSVARKSWTAVQRLVSALPGQRLAAFRSGPQHSRLAHLLPLG